MSDRSHQNVHPPMETARLRMRIIRPGDEEFLAELYADPVVMEHVHEGAVSWEEALRNARVDVELAAHRRFSGTWLVETRDGLVPLGWVQFSKLAGGDRDDFQLGYQFAPAHWGRGYATEAASRLLRCGFEALCLDRVAALVRKENVRSVRVLEKLGFCYVGQRREDCDYDDDAPSCNEYRLTAKGWRRRSDV